MSSSLSFLAALIVPVFITGLSVPLARRVGLVPLTFLAIPICHALLVLGVIASWDEMFNDAVARHDNAAMNAASNDGANKAFTLLFGWIPATIYCGLWYAILKFGVLRKLQPEKADK